MLFCFGKSDIKVQDEARGGNFGNMAKPEVSLSGERWGDLVELY